MEYHTCKHYEHLFYLRMKVLPKKMYYHFYCYTNISLSIIPIVKDIKFAIM